jgi:hypothetical protein
MTLERIAEELRSVAITTIYLFVCFCAVLFYRMAVLQKYGIDFAPFGLAAIKALVMAKFIMLGRMTGMGDRYKDKPLIYPVLHQSLLFLVLLIVLSLAEETIKGWFHGQSVIDVLRDMGGWLQIAATALLLWLVLVPYLGFIRLAQTLGEERLQKIVLGVAPSQSPKAVS